jgi:hypothetical protein
VASWTTVVAALSAVALLGGCGGEGTRTVTVREEATATSPSTAADGGASAPAEVASLVEGRGARSGREFTFRLFGLRRSGPTVVLNATLTTDPGTDRGIRIDDLFGDGLRQELEGRGGNEPADVFDGVALIDAQNRRKYLVARDAGGRCVCSNELSGVIAEPDVPVSLTATLGAPPSGVTRVDVVVPNVQTFAGVPLAG